MLSPSVHLRASGIIHCMSALRAMVFTTHQGTEAGGPYLLILFLLVLLLILPARLEWGRGTFPLAIPIFLSFLNYPGSTCLPGMGLQKAALAAQPQE